MATPSTSASSSGAAERGHSQHEAELAGVREPSIYI
jgi:hypothetical protein